MCAYFRAQLYVYMCIRCVNVGIYVHFLARALMECITAWFRWLCEGPGLYFCYTGWLYQWLWSQPGLLVSEKRARVREREKEWGSHACITILSNYLYYTIFCGVIITLKSHLNTHFNWKYIYTRLWLLKMLQLCVEYHVHLLYICISVQNVHSNIILGSFRNKALHIWTEFEWVSFLILGNNYCIVVLA